MGLKIFGTGGIDQKSNDLKRSPMKLRDARNMMATSRDEYSKRPGTGTDADFGTESFNDVIYIKSLGEYFFWNGTDYITYKGSVRRVPYAFMKGALPSVVNDISAAEYLNTAIFTHQTNPIAVCTYDGDTIYRSGLPTPATIVTSGSGTGFLLSFFEFIDAKGNVYYGPSSIESCGNSGSIDISFTTLKDTGFFAAYLNVTIDNVVPIVISSALRTLTFVTKSPDIVVGSKVVIRNRGTTILITDPAYPSRAFSDTFVILEVESVVGLVITFTASSIGTKSISIQLSFGPPLVANIHGGTSLRVLFSNSETTGYTTELSSINGQLVDNTLALNTGAYTFNTDSSILMSDFYDITTSKLRPPNCRFLVTYGYQIVCGGVISFHDFKNKEVTYSGNDDLIMYSDLSTGDLGVNFSELNRQLIGDTYDGEITGLTRVKDSLIIFKDRSVFSLDGVLIEGQYTLRKIETNEIGCLSDKSILQVEGSVLFQGQDGIYGINGYTAKKVSLELDPFFTTITPSLTRSVMNNDLDQYLFWTNQGIAVYDYQLDQWYIWNGIDGSKGVTVDNSQSIRFFSASLSKKFITAKNDSGVLIDGYIDTAWFDLAEPSILKKITDIRLFSLSNLGQMVSLSTYRDWDLSRVKSLSYNMAVGTFTQLRKIDIDLAQSFSFRIRNNVLNEDLNVSGYDVVCQIIQTRDKNVK